MSNYKKGRPKGSSEFVFPEKLLPITIRLMIFHLWGPGKGTRKSMPYSDLDPERTPSAVSKDVKAICLVVVKVNRLRCPAIYKQLCRHGDFGKYIMDVFKSDPKVRSSYFCFLSEHMTPIKPNSEASNSDEAVLDDTDGNPKSYTDADRKIDEEEQRLNDIYGFFNYGGER